MLRRPPFNVQEICMREKKGPQRARGTDGSTVPIGKVRLPVTFGKRDNYRTELIDFDVAHIRLPYNAILGYPALAKFMA